MMLSGNYGLGAFVVRESFREASVCFRGRGQMLGNMIHVANHVAVMLGSCCVAVARVSWRNHVAIMLRVSLGLFFFGFPQFLLGFPLYLPLVLRETSACFRFASAKLPLASAFQWKNTKSKKISCWRLRNMISCCFRESFREASACFRDACQINKNLHQNLLTERLIKFLTRGFSDNIIYLFTHELTNWLIYQASVIKHKIARR